MAFDPTSIFTAISNFFGFGIALAPSLNAYIEAKIPAEKQHVMKRRMAQCYRECKRKKLTGLNITYEVKLLFADLTSEQQIEIAAIITSELNNE